MRAGQFRAAILRRGFLGTFFVTPHRERLGSRPAHHALVGHLEAFARGRHAIGIQIQLLQQGGIAPVNSGDLVKAEIKRRTQIACVPLADVAQTITRIAQALRIEHDIGVHVAMHRGRRMHLVVDAVVPVIGAAQEHGARRTTDRGGRVTSLEQQPLARQPVDIRRAAARATGDGRPLLLVGHDVQDVRTLCCIRRLGGSRGDTCGSGEKCSAVQRLFRHAAPVRLQMNTTKAGCDACPTALLYTSIDRGIP